MGITTTVRRNWTEDETILAFFYYCQIPFGRISKTNPEIIRISKLIGRTPSAVGLKMGNLAHFDPTLQARNINGLSNASKLDEQIVNQFLNNWEELAYRASQIEDKFKGKHTRQGADDIIELPLGIDRSAITKQRINQDFFRSAVLSSYAQKCCITGIAIPTLLVASHIKPWKDSDPGKERTNPCNGLCLNALHDKAFDRGLITVLPDYTVRIASAMKNSVDSEEMRWLLACDGKKIVLPDKFLPQKEFLQYHNDVVFEKNICLL